MGLYERQRQFELYTSRSVTVVGCGGVGYWVAKFLAMSGMDKIYLFDPDTIEEHNLNRLDVPERFIGRNKADVTKLAVKTVRPMCSVHAFPYKLQAHTFPKTDWLVDCTDNLDSQIKNQKIADESGSNYVKSGYDGYGITINNRVGEWGEAQDGYVIEPSWVVPAVTVAALTVAKITRFVNSEIATTIPRLLGCTTPGIKKFHSMDQSEHI